MPLIWVTDIAYIILSVELKGFYVPLIWVTDIYIYNDLLGTILNFSEIIYIILSPEPGFLCASHLCVSVLSELKNYLSVTPQIPEWWRSASVSSLVITSYVNTLCNQVTHQLLSAVCYHWLIPSVSAGVNHSFDVSANPDNSITSGT